MKNAFMIAATGSGCGKTTITCALLKAIKERGLKPKSYKCGPDYIDPMFHKSVLKIESQNLDLFFSDEEEIRDIFYGQDDSDVSLVEGVMGLFDGVSPVSNAGSSYDLACRLDIPVVLVVNAHGMARSMLAVIKGFQSMDSEDRIKGVILNNISPAYYAVISKQIEKELDIKVLGYFPKMEEISIDSRYLGLRLPSEITKLESDIEKAAGVISSSVDFDMLFEITKNDNVDTEKKSSEKTTPYTTNNPVKIGVARDDAFCFYYEENFKLLKKLGAEIVEFSPIDDSELPPGICGFILGGGYPELYAKKLSENKGMLNSIKNAVSAGMPSLAECGGFMYLHDTIQTDGTDYPMVSVIDGICSKKDKLVRFGYISVEEKEKRFIEDENRVIKGHEFHYFDSTNNGYDAVSEKPHGGRNWEAAHISDNHWWGFAHLYYPSNVGFARSFINKCSQWRGKNE